MSAAFKKPYFKLTTARCENITIETGSKLEPVEVWALVEREAPEKMTLEESVGAYSKETSVMLCYMCGAALVKVQYLYGLFSIGKFRGTKFW